MGPVRRWCAVAATLAAAVGTFAIVTPATQAVGPTGPFTVDVTNREDVRAFYYRVHQAGENVPIAFTGNVAQCAAGTVSTDYLDAILARTNWFRAMAGVPSNVVFTAANNANAQAAALMMSTNKRLSHEPATTWRCFSPAGLDGARKSNLSLGVTGPPAVDGLMNDNGTPSLGHRRNMLNPRIATMGAGAVPSGPDQQASLAQYVNTTPLPQRPPVRDDFVSWPPKGFVPYQTTYAYWSFSYPNADFSAATVTMRRGDTPVAIKSHTDSTFGEPALIWRVQSVTGNGQWPRPEADETYTITLDNVVVDGTARSFTYDVTVFDPAVADPARTPLVVTGPDAVPVNQDATYSVNEIPNATGYQWRTERLTDVNIVDSADTGDTNFTAATAAYPTADRDVFASAPAGFRLTWSVAAGLQSLTLNRTLLVNPTSQLTFASRLEMINNLVARVQVSSDGGTTWTNVDEQITNGRQGVFTNRVVPLGALAGQKVQLRFVLDSLGTGGWSICCGPIGWYFDDVAITNVTDVAAPVVGAASTARTFVFRPTDPSQYDVSVRANFFGSGFGAWSSAKRVSSAPPAITTQPVGVTVDAGGQATFSVAATGVEPIAYQWTHNGVDLTDGDGVAGAQTATLRLTTVPATRAGSYAVRVSNGAGTTTSSTAELVVGQAATAPVITTQPQAQTLVAGGTATFTAAATGTPPLRWAWSFNGTPLADGPGVQGATTSVLTLTDVQPARAGDYTVRVENAAGNAVSNVARLTVEEPANLATALDATGIGLATAGDAPWTSQTGITRDGVDAAQSGRIDDDQASVLTATVTGPATLAFWWKVESEQNFDFLEVALDGTVQNRISGNVDWAEQTVAIPAGEHVVRWSYTKDRSLSAGRDAGWIDQVELRQPAPVATVADALDNTTLQFTDSGAQPWASQATTSRDGVDAAQSGGVTDNQASSLSTTITGPATLAFWWKVESEQNFDFLEVALDGTVQNRISGNVDWAEQTVAIPAGEHVVRWSYTKDRSLSAGRDAGWIDQLTVTRP